MRDAVHRRACRCACCRSSTECTRSSAPGPPASSMRAASAMLRASRAGAGLLPSTGRAASRRWPSMIAGAPLLQCRAFDNIPPSFVIQAHDVRRHTASRLSDCRETGRLACYNMSDVLAMNMQQELLMRVSHVLQRWQRGERQPQRGVHFKCSRGGACVHAGFRCAIAVHSSRCASP